MIVLWSRIDPITHTVVGVDKTGKMTTADLDHCPKCAMLSTVPILII
jgi:hypothetical protein